MASPSLVQPDKLSASIIERHLCAGADILRGSIESSGCQHFIFGSLSCQRIHEVWGKECEDRLRRYNGKNLATTPNRHRCHVCQGTRRQRQ